MKQTVSLPANFAERTHQTRMSHEHQHQNPVQSFNSIPTRTAHFLSTSHHVKSLSQFTCKGFVDKTCLLSSIAARLVHDHFNRRLFVFLQPVLVAGRYLIDGHRRFATLRCCSFRRCQRLNRCFPLGCFVASTTATGRRVIIHIVIHPPPPGKKTATVGFQ